MLDFGTDEGRVGLVGYFRGVPIVVVPRAILDDKLPIIIILSLFFSFFFLYSGLLLLYVVRTKYIP